MYRFLNKKMEHHKIENLSQKEALLNEYKGAIFEYLVGLKLSKHFNKEENFLENLNPAQIREIEFYQRQIWKTDKELYLALPILAQKSVDKFVDIYDSNELKLLQIKMTGRQKEYHQNKKKKNEADIELYWEQGNILPLSLKLCKEKSFVNTKSGGAKSFLAKYFHHPQSHLRQEDFNQKMDQLYFKFGLDLKESKDEGSTLADLPGQLPRDLKTLLHNYYASLILEIYQHMRFFYEDDPAQFMQDLAPLCGKSGPGIWQLICFHKQINLKRYQLSSLSVLNTLQLNTKVDEIEWQSPQEKNSSFVLRFQNFDLQIRIKPMNKFLTASYKINCSIKFHSEK